MKKIIAISSVLLGIVFLAGCGQRPVNQTQPTPPTPVAQTPVANQPAQISGMESWKTYHNSKYLFSVKYPNNWPIKEPTATDCDEKTICEIAIGNIPATPSADASLLVSILIHPAKVLADNKGDGFDQCSGLQKVTLTSGLQAEKKQCEGIDGKKIAAFSIDKNGTKYQVTHSIGSAEANNTFEKIANSFEFTK